MKRRRSVSRKKSKRSFKRASKPHGKNSRRPIMRGGYRL